ncbi:MAG: hypothetical protein ACO2OO_02095 [Candidatus Aenigmatarchaeota archaeon]
MTRGQANGNMGKVNNLYFVDWIYTFLEAITLSRENALIIAPASSGKSTLLQYITGNVKFYGSGTVRRTKDIIDAMNRTKADYLVIDDMAHLKIDELIPFLEKIDEPDKKFSMIAAMRDDYYEDLFIALGKSGGLRKRFLSRFILIRYYYTGKERSFIASRQLDTETEGDNPKKIVITPGNYIDKAKYDYPSELFFAIHNTFSKEEYHLRTIKKMNRIYTALIETYKDINRALGITTALLINQYKELNRLEFLTILSLFANVGKQYFEFYKGEKISDLLSLALNKIKNIVKKEVVKNEGNNKTGITTTSKNEENKS